MDVVGPDSPRHGREIPHAAGEVPAPIVNAVDAEVAARAEVAAPVHAEAVATKCAQKKIKSFDPSSLDGQHARNVQTLRSMEFDNPEQKASELEEGFRANALSNMDRMLYDLMTRA